MWKFLITAASFLALGIAITSTISLQYRASRVELPEMPVEAYLPIMKRCVDSFVNPSSPNNSPKPDHPPIDVIFQGDLTFLLHWYNRSGNLSLQDDALVEDVQLRMRVTRNFRNSNLVEADITPLSAKQMPWQKGDGLPSNDRLQPFDSRQLEKLDLYTNYLSSFLTVCASEQALMRKDSRDVFLERSR